MSRKAASCSRLAPRRTPSCSPRPRPSCRFRWRAAPRRSRPPPRAASAVPPPPPFATKAARTVRGPVAVPTCAPVTILRRTSRWSSTPSRARARSSSAPIARPSFSTMLRRAACGCPTRTWSSWTTGTRSKTSSRKPRKKRTAPSSRTRSPTRSSVRKTLRPRPWMMNSVSAPGARRSFPSLITTPTWTETS